MVKDFDFVLRAFWRVTVRKNVSGAIGNRENIVLSAEHFARIERVR